MVNAYGFRASPSLMINDRYQSDLIPDIPPCAPQWHATCAVGDTVNARRPLFEADFHGAGEAPVGHPLQRSAVRAVRRVERALEPEACAGELRGFDRLPGPIDQ